MTPRPMEEGSDLSSPLLESEGVGIGEGRQQEAKGKVDALHEESGSFETSSLPRTDSETIDEHGLRFSITSNSFFFVGSLIKVVLSAWDLDSLFESEDSRYYTLWSALGNGSFLLNALVDIAWALWDLRGQQEWKHHHRHRVYATVAFGIGAMLEIAAVFVYPKLRSGQNVLAMAAEHIYLLSAFPALTERSTTLLACMSGKYGARERLQSAGDILFLMGSAVDALLSYFDVDSQSSSRQKLLGKWLVFSSTLWLLDSILYVLSSCSSYALTEQVHEADGETKLSGEEDSSESSAEGEKQQQR